MKSTESKRGSLLVRILPLLLTIAMTVPLAACGNNGGNPNETPTSDPNAGETQNQTGIESPYEDDQLPEDLDYEDEIFNICCWNGAPTYEFYVDIETQDSPIAESVWKRNTTIEDRLNITLRFHSRDGDNASQKEFLMHLDNTVGKGLGTYDLVASYTMCGGAMMTRGYNVDLNRTEYFRSDMPWWPSNLTKDATIDGRLYFASGDISTNMLWSMFAILYNQDLYDAYGFEDDLDALVDGKTWTLEKMMELASAVYGERDNKDGKTEGDLYGFQFYSVYSDAFFYGSGLKTTERDEVEGLVISPTWGSETTQSLLEDLADYMETDYVFFAESGMIDDWSKKTHFVNGSVLFDLRPFYYIYQVINAEGQDKEVHFGVLPVPMYTQTQGNYYTTVGFTYSLYSIPYDTPDEARSSAVLECMGSEAYRKTTPVIFEETMKIRYSKDDKVSHMFDVVRDGISFDIGRFLCSEFKTGNYNNATYRMFRDAVIEGDTNWMSTFKKESESLSTILAKLIMEMDKLAQSREKNT